VSENDRERSEPRWLRLAADVHAEPAPGTLARVRARLAAGAAEPTWVRWLARPATLAASLALLVAAAWAGDAWLSSNVGDRSDESSLVSALLGEDGSYGIGTANTDAGAALGSDSAEVTR
jgi:hypothetical protein